MLADVENALVVGSDVLTIVVMSSWPLIIIKLKLEDFGGQQILNLNSHRNQIREIFVEQVR